jgi:serine acetyltransferase
MNRRLALEQRPLNLWNRLITIPKRGFVSVLIYRAKRYLHFKDNALAKILIRILKFPEFHYCHNELDPRADIGPGLVLSDLGGVGLGFTVIIGKNCTFMGKGTPTLGAMEGIDLHNDRIRIGNYCVIGHNVKIINPVVIADYVQMTPNSVLMTHVKTPGTVMTGFPAKAVDVINSELVKAWSPLVSRPLYTAQ